MIISNTARNRTHNLFRLKREPIPLGHSDGLAYVICIGDVTELTEVPIQFSQFIVYMCSGSIVVTTLDCGPGGSWFESRVGNNIL